MKSREKDRPVRVAGNSTEYVQDAGLPQSFIAEIWV